MREIQFCSSFNVEKTEFCLGFIKLRTVFLNSLTDSACRISSLSLAHSLTVYGKRMIQIFCSFRKSFILFWFNDLV